MRPSCWYRCLRAWSIRSREDERKIVPSISVVECFGIAKDDESKTLKMTLTEENPPSIEDVCAEILVQFQKWTSAVDEKVITYYLTISSVRTKSPAWVAQEDVRP